MRKRSSLSTASFAWITPVLYCDIPIVARITMSEITTRSSIIVKPRSRALPVLIFGSIERLAIEGCVNVEDVLAAPMRRGGLVLIRAHAPLGGARHRIHRHSPEKFQLATGRVVVCGDTLDERLEIRRIAFGAGLEI